MNLLDQALGLHPNALEIGARRLDVLASNMANADTPGYKARDVDFGAALSAASEQVSTAALRTTHPGHRTGAGGAPGGETLYRVPESPSLDGNTVDSHKEQAEFAEASIRYQASLHFLTGRLAGLRKALSGE